MTKKNRVLTGIGIIFLIILILWGIWLKTGIDTLGNINHSSLTPATATSEIRFSAEKGDIIRIIFTSEILSGDLNIVLYDSEGQKAKVLGKARTMKTILTIDQADTYTLAVEYTDFTGQFKMKAFRLMRHALPSMR